MDGWLGEVVHGTDKVGSKPWVGVSLRPIFLLRPSITDSKEKNIVASKVSDPTTSLPRKAETHTKTQIPISQNAIFVSYCYNNEAHNCLVADLSLTPHLLLFNPDQLQLHLQLRRFLH